MKLTKLNPPIYRFLTLIFAVTLILIGLMLFYYRLNVKAIISVFAGVIEIMLSNQPPKITSWLQVFAVTALVFYIIEGVLVNMSTIIPGNLED